MGRLFQLQTLGLNGNPLQSDLIELYSSPNGTYELIGYLLDNQPLNLEPPGMILLFARNFTCEPKGEIFLRSSRIQSKQCSRKEKRRRTSVHEKKGIFLDFSRNLASSDCCLTCMTRLRGQSCTRHIFIGEKLLNHLFLIRELGFPK